MIVAIIYGIWVIVCLHLITKTIRENSELHLVYKRPKWVQRWVDKVEYRDKQNRLRELKKRIESTQYESNNEKMKSYITEFFELNSELKAIDKRQPIHYKHSQVGNYP